MALVILTGLVAPQSAVRAQEFAIDISNGTGDITLDDVGCWVGAEGVRHIIVKAAIQEETSGLNRETSRQQLETLWRAKYEQGLDFSVDLYLYVHWPNNPILDPPFTTPIREQVREAIQLLHELDIGFPPLAFKPWGGGRLWIDLEETPPPGQTADQTVGLIREVLDACMDGPDDPYQRFFPCGIYTRKDWWVDHTGNTTEFSTYPLWYANYGCPLDPTFNDFEPFGGWTAPVGKQYADNKPANCSGNLCSRSVDYDIMYLGDLDGLATPTGLDPPAGTEIQFGNPPYNQTLSWDPVSGNPSRGPVSYEVIYNYEDSVVERSASTNEIDTWLNPDTHYRWRVIAHNNYGNSEPARSAVIHGYKPDLKTSGIWFTEDDIFEGLRMTAVATLENGGQSSSGIFNVKWFHEKEEGGGLDEVSYGSHGSLAPGEISGDNVRYDFTVEEGCHTLMFIADVDAHVSEANEYDNWFSQEICAPPFSEYHPPEPDLKVRGIQLTSKAAPGVGTTAMAELVNAGGVASGVFNVKWFLDGIEVGSGSHVALAPGAVSEDNVPFDWTPTPGEHKLTFTADVDDDVDEGEEANNSFEFTVEVPEPPTPPDLEVVSIEFESTPVAGRTTTAIAKVVNVGGLPSGLVKMRWWLDGVVVGHGSHSSMAPGEVSTGNFWPLHWMATAGVHTLSFSADIEHAVEESNESNNSFKVEIEVPSPPDLEVSGIRFTSPPVPGRRTTAVARLSNVGGLASGVFNVKWFLDGVQVGYGSHASLAPGDVSKGNVRLDWIPTPGEHRLRFSADVDNMVQESDEGNNTVQIRVSVHGGLPDLDVKGIRLTSTPRAGVLTTAVVRLVNGGRSPSGVFNVKWFLDGVEVGYGSHASLAPGEVSKGNVRFDWTPTPGTHTLRFKADVDNHVGESNEKNNRAEISVTVQHSSR